jgi:hypothetical protein
MADSYVAIRSELEAAQKARDELMKWKVIGIAGIGAAALGFADGRPRGAHLALAVIPFACAYVDLLCRNLSIRSKRISVFLRRERVEDPIVRLEKFYAETKARSALESVALVGSSVVLSIVIVPIGLAITESSSLSSLAWPRSLFWGSGVLGLLFAVVVEFLYWLRKREIGAA